MQCELYFVTLRVGGVIGNSLLLIYYECFPTQIIFLTFFMHIILSITDVAFPLSSSYSFLCLLDLIVCDENKR